MLTELTGRRLDPLKATDSLRAIMGRSIGHAVNLSDIDAGGSTFARVKALDTLKALFRLVKQWPGDWFFPPALVETVKGSHDVLTAKMGHFDTRWRGDMKRVPFPSMDRNINLLQYGMGVEVDQLAMREIITRYGVQAAGSVGYVAMATAFAECLVLLDLEFVRAAAVLADIVASGNVLTPSVSNRWPNSGKMKTDIAFAKAAIRAATNDPQIPDDAFGVVFMGTAVDAAKGDKTILAQLPGRSGDTAAIDVPTDMIRMHIAVGDVQLYPMNLPGAPWGGGNDAWVYVRPQDAYFGAGAQYTLRGYGGAVVPVDMLKTHLIRNTTVFGHYAAVEPAVTLPGGFFRIRQPNEGT